MTGIASGSNFPEGDTMKPAMPLLTTSRVFLAAAVLATLMTGCGRHDQSTAGASSADNSARASAGMGKDASTAAASNSGSTGNTVADSTAAASPAPTGMTPATDTGSGASGTGTSASAAPAATPNDAQIAGIVMTANNGEIDAGKLAESKAQNPKVKEFARSMIKEHTDMNQQAAALAKKKQMSPAESDVTKTLKDDSAKVAANLKSMSGAGFDKAYIDSQVNDHEKVLMMIDNVLLPNAKDADLKAMLQKARPAVNMHLDQAKALQTAMK
jgi:putative membrane protein